MGKSARFGNWLESEINRFSQLLGTSDKKLDKSVPNIPMLETTNETNLSLVVFFLRRCITYNINIRIESVDM